MHHKKSVPPRKTRYSHWAAVQLRLHHQPSTSCAPQVHTAQRVVPGPNHVAEVLSVHVAALVPKTFDFTQRLVASGNGQVLVLVPQAPGAVLHITQQFAAHECCSNGSMGCRAHRPMCRAHKTSQRALTPHRRMPKPRSLPPRVSAAAEPHEWVLGGHNNIGCDGSLLLVHTPQRPIGSPELE